MVIFATMLQKNQKLTSQDVLKQSGLSATRPRKLIVDLLLHSDEAVTGPGLEKAFQACCNRSTIYRNLTALTEAGLIHRINLDGESRYKIHPKFVNENFDVNHPHFECLKCGRLFCLHNQEITHPDLPEGFIAKEINFVIYGYCDQCR